jgi:hypothetical protein
MLALWAYNFNWSGSSSATATASLAVASTYTYTSGKGKNGDNNTYQMLPDEYWDVRESKLLRATDPAKVSIFDEDELPPVKTATLMPRAQNSAPQGESRATTLAALRNASSVEEMRAISAKLRRT